MVPDPTPARLDAARGAVIGGNLVPLAGVLALGWSSAVFLGVYLLELCAVLLWTAVRIPFATKRPRNALDERHSLLAPLQEKRGGTRLWWRLPPAYLRNVPTLLVFVFLLAPLLVSVGFLVFALTGPTVTEGAVGSMLLGGVAVFAARGIETHTDYFRDGRYRDHSPRSVILAPFKALFALGFLLVAFVGLRAAGGAPDARWTLALIAVGKLAYDLRRERVRRDPERRGLFAKLYGSAATEIEPTAVESPAGEPNDRVEPVRAAALADASLRGVAYGLIKAGFVVYPVGLFVGLATGVVWGVVAAGLVAIPFAATRAATRYLRWGTLEYRAHDGEIVAYDRLLGEPQASLDTDAITDVSVSERYADRPFGTATVELDALESDEGLEGIQLFVPEPEELPDEDPNENRPMALRYVADPDAVIAAIDPPASATYDGGD